jgi:hypothetical protein
MKVWELSYEGAEDLKFLADGSSEFTEALDLQLDLSEKGLDFCSRKYSLLVNDLVVKVANIEKGGAFAISGGEKRGFVLFLERGQKSASVYRLYIVVLIVIPFEGSGHGVLCANNGVQESLGRCPNIAQLLARAFK